MRIVFYTAMLLSALGAVVFGVMSFKTRDRSYIKKLIVCMVMVIIAAAAMPEKAPSSPSISETSITQSPVTASVSTPAPAQTDTLGQAQDTPVQTDAADGTLVASTRSDKYHLPSCPSAGKILPENKVWFDSAEEAEASGYSPCGRCKPG